jgi:hypothetical protein
MQAFAGKLRESSATREFAKDSMHPEVVRLRLMILSSVR